MDSVARKHRIQVVLDDTEEKIKTSLFLLTINSNQVITDKECNTVRRKMSEFKKEIRGILETIPEYIKVNGHAVPDDSMIINVKSFTEIGKKQNRLHCHAIVEIRHNSNIHIDVKKITEITGYYVNCTFMRSSGDINRMLAYIRKQI